MAIQSFNITCPECKAEFPLTETLAQPLIIAERAKDQKEARERAAGLKKEEQELARQRKTLDDLQRQLTVREGKIHDAVDAQLQTERKSLAELANRKAAQLYATKLLAAEQELSEKRTLLAEAEKAELALRKERRVLEEGKRKLELEVERRLHEERQRIREETQKEESESNRLKLAERDKLLSDLKKQVEELRRKSDVGSQQLQGEVQEIALEVLLKDSFPGDVISPIESGRLGGDVIQKVIGRNGTHCGTILWESKRTRAWRDEWLTKNRADQRRAHAQIGVIATVAMPKNVDSFGQLENVWVTCMRCVQPLAMALRLILIETAMSKAASEGQDGRMERIYGYLTGSHFRTRVSAMVEACVAMQEDDEAEKRSLQKQWAKRQCRRDLLITEMAGMWGDLQAVVGKGMPEVQGFTLPSLAAGPGSDSDDPFHVPDNKEDAA